MQEEKPSLKPVKRQMTEKQKAARLANLEAGRNKRKEMIKQKKEQTEYDLSSEDSYDTESDSDDAFIISKKKKASKRGKSLVKKPRSRRDLIESKDVGFHDNHLQGEVNELKSMVAMLANMQKKQTKRKPSKKSGGTKIVVLPQNQPNAPPVRSINDTMLDSLRKSLFS
jgi:hypothetical protein